LMAHKGFRAVGLNEVLVAAKVPKGSFYHYFESKDAFGLAVMGDYFVSYLANMDRIFSEANKDAAARLIDYLMVWRERNSVEDFTSGCLFVTLGPEAANFSDNMRDETKAGVAEIIERLRRVIAEGVADESMTTTDPQTSAELLFEMWVGASIMAKIRRSAESFDTSMAATRQHLRLR
jgi:TetR/AcrR family transcriptional repressor of nem operon